MDRDELTARLAAELRADPRVRSAWLTGSIGRGADDEFSDVDTWVVVDQPDRASFEADWPATCARIAPVVLFQRLALGDIVVLNQITDEWLRFDVTLGSSAEAPSRSAALMTPICDPTGLAAQLRDDLGEPLQPSAGQVERLVTEFFRVLGLLPVVIGRHEYVVAASGAGLLRTMLIQLMIEDVAVPDRGGALHLAALLPAERLAVLTALPPIAATRESAIAAHLACAAAFLPLARDLADHTGVSWPDALETAARTHLHRTLNLELG